MKHTLYASLALAMAIAVMPASGLAAGLAYDKCAAEASSPFQKGFAEIGREDFAVDSAAAVAACEVALDAEPNSAQVKTWLARAYYLAGREGDAFAILETMPLERNPLGAMVFGLMMQGSSAEVALDDVRALAHLKMSAEAGFAPAQYHYGNAFDNAYGVEQDLAEAEKWYRRSADQNHGRGLAALGSMYLYGEGVPFDEEEGLRLLSTAGEMGEPIAWQYLGIAYANAPNLGPNYEKAAEYFAKAVELGDAYSMVELGYYYDAGWGVEQDLDKAFELTKRGAELGNAHGYSNLAYYYKNGIGTPVDLEAAFDAAKNGAELGSVFSAVNLGWYYLKGIGTEPNCEEALRWTTVGYDANDINSIENMGEHYHRACGVDEDLLKARDLYRTALEGGSTTAQPLLDELKTLMKTRDRG